MQQVAMSPQVLSNRLFFFHNKPRHEYSTFSPVSAAHLVPGVGGVRRAEFASLPFEEIIERTRKLIHKPEISISPYDTAWVAMMPSPKSTVLEPCFPDCLDWLLQNQCPDGSWAQPHHHSLLQKDVISSTLASVLALKKWNLAHHQVHRGIHFIESNFTLITGKDQLSPMGFDIIFAGMVEYAKDLSLDLNLEPKLLNGLISNRNLELKRCHEGQSVEIEAYMAYVSEGIGKLQDWESIMKYQRKNGSLFNSPSTTAAACIFHQKNDGCLDYLHSALNSFGNAVPAIYPNKLYAQLCIIDNLEQLGISHYFSKDVESVLDEIYRRWLQGEDEILMDVSTCALAFRLLRVNGYDITSDQINEVLEEVHPARFLGGDTTDIHRTLDAYRASEIVFPNEADLEKHNLRLKLKLEHELSASSCYSNELGRNIRKEVTSALQHPFYAITERYVNRRNIENFTSDNTRILKTSFCSPNFGSKGFFPLSVADFNKSQRVHQEELKELERWVVENRLDELKFARQKYAYCYVSAATTFSSPEQSDARIAYAKSAVLATVVDDFFDVGGSFNELNNLIQLIEVWDANLNTECSSENVLILVSALKSTICEIGEKAFIQQGRNVMKHIIDIWLELLYSMLRETEWERDGYRPSMDEYMKNGYISFALGPVVLTTLYLVGPKLSEEMVHHPNYSKLFKMMSTCSRLLNDFCSYQEDMKKGKNNVVPLYMMNDGGNITEEVAIAAVRRMIECNRRELHRLVLNGKDNALPRACKDVAWRTIVVLQQIYSKDDAYSTDGLGEFVKSILYEPVGLRES